jgi:hypothetical protein
MSQNISEFGVGYSITFRTRVGCPMSTKMNIMHMTTAEIARNSPRIVIRANTLKLCR